MRAIQFRQCKPEAGQPRSFARNSWTSMTIAILARGQELVQPTDARVLFSQHDCNMSGQIILARVVSSVLSGRGSVGTTRADCPLLGKERLNQRTASRAIHPLRWRLLPAQPPSRANGTTESIARGCISQALHLRQGIILARHPHVQRRHQEHADNEVGDQAANNDNGKRPLRVGPDSVRKRCRQQTQRCH